MVSTQNVKFLVMIKTIYFKITVPGPVSGLTATLGVVQLTIPWSPPNGIITTTHHAATQHTLSDLHTLSVLLLHSESEHTPS